MRAEVRRHNEITGGWGGIDWLPGRRTTRDDKCPH
jgi:hypothetical protein